MPSTSTKQHGFMAAIANNPSFAKKVGVPQSVGKDFNEADKGRKFGKGGTTQQRINKQDTKHGKMDLPVANLNRMAGMKAGGIMMTKPMKAGGGMPMKDGRPAFLKKMNMGGMAKYAKGGSVRRFEIGGGVSFEDYLKDATKDYSRKGETLEDAAARRNPAPIRDAAPAAAPAATANSVVRNVEPKKINTSHYDADVDDANLGDAMRANSERTSAAPTANLPGATSVSRPKTKPAPQPAPQPASKAAPNASRDTEHVFIGPQFGYSPKPEVLAEKLRKIITAQTPEKEESDTGRNLAIGAAGLTGIGAAAYALKKGKVKPAMDYLRSFLPKAKEAAPVDKVFEVAKAKAEVKAATRTAKDAEKTATSEAKKNVKFAKSGAPLRETRSIAPTGDKAIAAMQGRNDAAFREAGKAEATMKGYAGLPTAEKIRLGGGLKKGGPVKRFAKGGTIMKGSARTKKFDIGGDAGDYGYGSGADLPRAKPAKGVSKAQLAASGLSLRDYMNRDRGLTRKETDAQYLQRLEGRYKDNPSDANERPYRQKLANTDGLEMARAKYRRNPTDANYGAMWDEARPVPHKKGGPVKRFAKGGGIESRGKTRGTIIRMAAGGSVSSASSRADGIAQRGRTNFRIY